MFTRPISISNTKNNKRFTHHHIQWDETLIIFSFYTYSCIRRKWGQFEQFRSFAYKHLNMKTGRFSNWNKKHPLMIKHDEIISWIIFSIDIMCISTDAITSQRNNIYLLNTLKTIQLYIQNRVQNILMNEIISFLVCQLIL